MLQVRYVSTPNSYLVPAPGDSPDETGTVGLLLGSRIHTDEATAPAGWVHATTVPNKKHQTRSGFIQTNRISDRQQLKIFYLDVGQGDAALIEAHNRIVIIDAGPNNGFLARLEERRDALRRADQAAGIAVPDRLHIDAVVITHFDLDHYYGLVPVLESEGFSIGRIYHNGLPRYSDPDDRDLNLGTFAGPAGDTKRAISTELHKINSARDLLASGAFLTKKQNLNMFAEFLDAAVKAHDAGRLGELERLVRRDPTAPVRTIPNTGPDLAFEILGPLTTAESGAIRLPTFHNPESVTATNPRPAPSESHTLNGNSIVLRLAYGTGTYLFGGDLNQPAQRHLEQQYPDLTPFAADVNKACHHGSSDFDLAYLKAVNPHATVFSSGDNGTYDHPLPDAIGSAAKQSRGDFPLVFSTELARESTKKGVKLFGHINARSNGTDIVIAQKKEKPSLADEWHDFALPYTGPFTH